MAKCHSRGQEYDDFENSSSSDAAFATMMWEDGNCLLMTPAYRTFGLVINKGDLDCVMCSSYQTERRMNMYRYDVERVLRMGDLKDEDGDNNNNKGGERKGGTTTTLSTEKNSTRKDKKKSVTTTAAKKKKNKKKPTPLLVGW